MKSTKPAASPDPPDFYTGSVIAAVGLRYRDAFIDRLWEVLRVMHVLVKAPRRCGKTRVMEHLRRYPRHGFTVMYA